MCAQLHADDIAMSDVELSAVRIAASTFANAVARGDADAVRKSWTKNGDCIDAAGERLSVKDFIHKVVSKQRGDSVKGQGASRESTIRLVAPGVAIEDGTYDFVISNEEYPKSRRFTAVWVKPDSKWLLDSLRESMVEQAPLAGRLKPLEFLLGEWTGEMADSVVLISARLSDAGNYIIRDFAVLVDGAEATATERIGYDPSSDELKSWTFDSQDGRSEATWKRDGDHWNVITKEIMADGSQAQTTATVAPGDGNHFVWKVTKSTIGDQSLPTLRIKFKRAPEDQ
jgi:uncharacterized protein (TIGR02246 family)